MVVVVIVIVIVEVEAEAEAEAKAEAVVVVSMVVALAWVARGLIAVPLSSSCCSKRRSTCLMLPHRPPLASCSALTPWTLSDRIHMVWRVSCIDGIQSFHVCIGPVGMKVRKKNS
jgi:hypothetical protein